MKKISALLLSAILICTMFSGCLHQASSPYSTGGRDETAFWCGGRFALLKGVDINFRPTLTFTDRLEDMYEEDVISYYEADDDKTVYILTKTHYIILNTADESYSKHPVKEPLDDKYAYSVFQKMQRENLIT